MPAQRLKATENRNERSRSRSPWVRDTGPPLTDVARASTIHNDNKNQSTACGSANIVNNNPSFNLQSSSVAAVHHSTITNITMPVSVPDPSVRSIRDLSADT